MQGKCYCQPESTLGENVLDQLGVAAWRLWMRRFSLAVQQLAVALGLPVMLDEQPCMGYQNCCACEDCRERERMVRRPVPKQPWEKAA